MMSHNHSQVQLEFFEKIKATAGPGVSLVDIISEVLSISSDSAYRRLRGVTTLTLEDITRLCNHFNVSFDLGNSQHEKGVVTFHYRTISDKEERMAEYLTDLQNHLRQISGYKNKLIIYAAEDVPVFHHFKYEELTAFKIFYWRKSVLDEKLLSNVNFDFKKIDKKLIDIARETYALYTHIPSVEIWTEATLDSTVKQLDYYYESGIVNKEQALIICRQILQVIGDVEQMAVNSTKNAGDEGNYKMYYSDVMIGTNAVQVVLDGKNTTFLSFNTFNNLSTTNAILGAEVNAWMKNLIRKASLISGVNEKQRLQIFKKIKLNAESVLRKIESRTE